MKRKSLLELTKEYAGQRQDIEDAALTIEREVPYVDIKPYSHNIISVTLQYVSKIGGNAEANKLIRKFGLKKLGWKEVK